MELERVVYIFTIMPFEINFQTGSVGPLTSAFTELPSPDDIRDAMMAHTKDRKAIDEILESFPSKKELAGLDDSREVVACVHEHYIATLVATVLWGNAQ